MAPPPGGMTTLHRLAQAAGLARTWHDAEGRPRTVTDDGLDRILTALGHAAVTEGDQRRSLDAIAAGQATIPTFLSGDVGRPVVLPPSFAQARQAEIVGDEGDETVAVTDGQLPPLSRPGYYRLRMEGHDLTLAIAPRHCPVLEGPRRWGVGVQIPALRECPASAFGTLADLRGIMPTLARHGADAVAISPVHALFPGDGTRYSPYAPSSRLFLNGALAQPLAGGPTGELIDWSDALPRQFAALSADFAALTVDRRAELENMADAASRRHALFDALNLHFGTRGWPDWPTAFHDPDGQAVRSFVDDHGDAIALHLFAQRRADAALANAQAAAREAGMAIGLISDLAVGVDPGGSDAWAMRTHMLHGLTIGAPPDPLGPLGQNWGLTSFSPQGLQASGFAPFIAMLRAALSHAGGIRIDHAFGLQRLWVVPQGAEASEGAYLAYPVTDLLRIITLEAARAKAIVIAEDLGTHPPGFAEAIADRRMMGMRVLWFERDGEGRFTDPASNAPASVAMTGTHDTPTVSGWWRGRDLEWNARLGRSLPDADAARERDRGGLWDAIGGDAPRPAAHDPGPVVDAALAHVGAASSRLAIAPLEDVLGLDEQPNLPGTIDAHPNWRRRLPASFDTLATQPATARRLAMIDRSRKA